MSPGMLWPTQIRYSLDPNNTKHAWFDLDWFECWCGPYLPTLEQYDVNYPIHFRKLAALVEGGGKRRIIAIGNYINQRLLKPYHDWAMKVLQRLPNDGTYDQTGPLRFLRGCKNVYSFDLKSATDQWQLTVIFSMMSMFFGPSLASSVVQGTLAYNAFDVPFVKRRSVGCFVTGQPLGYYSSWPLFALSHHFVVWMAADRVYGPRSRFKAYAILGDDVIIGDSLVAREYESLLSDLGVTISKQKCLISDSEALEFAKRYVVNKGLVDLSPVSIKSLMLCHTTVGLCLLGEKYGIQKFSTLARLGGAGYRTLSSINRRRTKRWERLFIAHSKPGRESPFPLEWWIGRDYPLNLYLFGLIVSFLRGELRPKELRLPPDSLTFDSEVEILERTLIRNWVSSWVKYVH